MNKIVLLFYISNAMVVQAFFITGQDIRKFFGIGSSSFYDIYRNEASQNHPHDNDEREQYHNRKYENNINEKLPSAGYYYKIRPSDNIFEHVREYSTKKENTSPYTKMDEDCDLPHIENTNRCKNSSSNDHYPKVYLQLPPILKKLQTQANKNEEELDATKADATKKDIISGVLLALPNLNINVKELLSQQNDANIKNNDKYFIKALFSNTPQPVYAEETNESENIFF